MTSSSCRTIRTGIRVPRPVVGAAVAVVVSASVAGSAFTAAGASPRISHSDRSTARHEARTPTMPRYGNPHGHAYVPPAGRAVGTRHPDHVIGRGTPRGCTSAAVVRAVAKGGVITFNCGPAPVTITMHATAKVRNTSHRVVLDGGGLVTLSGGGSHRILYMNTCDRRQTWTTSHCNNQRWPFMVVQNLTFEDGYSAVRQTSTSSYGGGAIFDTGGQLKVVNSRFIDNRCYRVGPDLGGAAIRALEQWQTRPVYITDDTFRGGRCSNGSALSSIGVSWVVLNALMTHNRATGHGANPASAGSPGGGSGGAIYTDGDHYVTQDRRQRDHQQLRPRGRRRGLLRQRQQHRDVTIRGSTLHHNPSAGFWTRPYPGIFYQSFGHRLKVIHSTIN